MNTVASPAHSPVRGGARLTITDTISVDTSVSLVDTPPHQQDSGSNQSGSDSGFGYSNTASDNSFNTKAAKNVLGIPGSSSSSLLSQDNKSNNKTVNNPQNRITATNNHLVSSCKQDNHTKDSESACSTFTGIDNSNSVVLQDCTKATKLASNFSSLTNESSSQKSSPNLPLVHGAINRTGIVTQRNTNQRTCTSEPSNDFHLHTHPNELISSSSPPSSTPKTPRDAAPVLKSLLKRPTGSELRDKLPKHNRSVSFNQTVIVFCEEIVTSSSSPIAALNASTGPVAEQLESQLPHSQLDDYHSTSPNQQYCDAKNSTSQLVNIGLEGALGESATDLDDKRLFSLLEDESLLESFHSQHGDGDFSDDDFTGNSLNYLSIDAISDYDSDSESSSIVDWKEHNKSDSTGLLKTNNYHTTEIHHHPKKASENESRILKKESKKPTTVKNVAPPLGEPTHQPAKIATQKLMPARLKVKSVETTSADSHNSHRESENSNLLYKTFVSDRFRANAFQKHSTYATCKNFENSFTNTAVFPVSYDSSGKHRESHISDFEESSGILGVTNCHIQQHEHSRLAGQTQRTENNRSSIPLHQPNTISSNTKTEQGSGCCEVCKLIESHKSIPLSGFAANRSQTTSHDDSVTKIASTLHEETTPRQANNFYNSLPQRPTVLSQSCVSCRELSMKQAIIRSTGTSSSSPQTATPLACQIVYLVDQKGNRIRAISVLRSSNQNGATNSNQPYRQFYVPTSTVLLPSARDTSSQFMKTEQTQASPNGTLVTNAINVNNLTQLSRNGQQMQDQQSEPASERKQLVYYIRQPLDSQNLQKVNLRDHTARSFPQPHEIRRLDGMKGPTSVSDLVNRESGKATYSSRNFNTVTDSPRGNSETTANASYDPTFGFSQRPSVKVVANFIKPPQDFAAPQSSAYDYGSVFSSESLKQNFIGGRPPYILNSQTLGRPNNDHTTSKEALPSTSSMSNINQTLSSLSAKAQHSGGARQVMNDNESKLSIVNKMQQSNIVISHARFTQGKHPNDDVHRVYDPTGSMKAQKTNKVLYSMNI